MMQGSEFSVVEGEQQKSKSEWDFFLTDLDGIIEYLNSRYPEMGIDNACFAVYVIMFSALAVGTSNPFVLQRFTGYRMEFVQAVLFNLGINGLIHNGQYVTSRWLRDGRIHNYKLWEEMEAACGNLWLPGAEKASTLDINAIEYKPRQPGKGKF
jgi:hypothetical protein